MARGGARPGAGRKPKDEEDKAKRLSIEGLITAFGGEKEAFEHAAKQSKSGGKDGLPYFKLLIEYAYGKPKETISTTHSFNDFDLKEALGFDNPE